MGRLRLLEFHCRFRFWSPRRLDHEQRPGAYRDAELESAARGTAGRDQLESHHPYFGLAHQLLPRTDGRIWRRRGGITRISDPDHERVEIAGAVYFLSPVIGMIVGITVTITTTWIAKDQRPKKVDRWFRRSQLLSAAGYSLGHSTNDAQKGMGIITAGGRRHDENLPCAILGDHLLPLGDGRRTMAGGGVSSRPWASASPNSRPSEDSPQKLPGPSR